PVGLILVPGRGMGGAGLLHEQLVVEEVGRGRAHQLGGDGWSRGVERSRAEVGILLPHEHVAEELPGGAALGEVGGVGSGRGEVALDGAAQALDPMRVEELAQADDAVALVGADVAVGDQTGDKTWMVREAIRSRVLAPYSFMCGATECAFRSSAVSHLSITTKVSGPNLAVPMPSTSTVG